MIHYRLRVRDQADAADALVISSVPSDTNPYIQAPPSGDGQSVDPVTGKSTIGAYTIRVIDPKRADGTRPVTSVLTDVNRRQQLPGRRAYIEYSTTGGTSWTVLTAGYVIKLRLVSPLTFEFTVGDSQRQETRFLLFDRLVAPFDAVSCLIGGPVRGGFGVLRDFGGWRMRVVRVEPGKFVQLVYVKGYQRRSVEFANLFSFAAGGYESVDGHITDYEDRRVNALSRSFFRYVGDKNLLPLGIAGEYPGLEARVQNPDGTLKGTFTPLNRIDEVKVGPLATAGSHVALVDRSTLVLKWQSSQPTVGQQFDIYVYPTAINQENPVHLTGHPVDLITQAWTLAGLPWSASAAAAARAGLGPDLSVALRIAEPMALTKFVEMLSGPFGLGSRINTAGEREVLVLRRRSATAPVTTITVDQLRDAGDPFDVDEKRAVTRVTYTSKNFDLWVPSKLGDDSARPIDELVTTPVKVSIDFEDPGALEPHEVTYDLPGYIHYREGYRPPPEEFLVTVARPLFDRRGRSAVTGSIRCLPSVTAQVGDTVILDVPHRPNDNQRGGPRVVQVLRRTETPGGPELDVEDLGVTNQPAVTPTFTLAKDTGTDPKRYALITITNAAALAADGDTVVIAVAFSLGGVDMVEDVRIPPEQLSGTPIQTPQAHMGSVIVVRMHSEKPGFLPGSPTVTQTVTLDGPSAPTGFTVTPDPNDSSAADLAWTPGGDGLPLVVQTKRTSEPTSAWRTDRVLPAGSTKHRLTGLALSTQYDVRVFHQEQAPFHGTSAAVTATFTTGAVTPALRAPDNPRAFAGSVDPATNGLVADGTYGLEVLATVLPSAVVFEEAIETAPGSGTYGAFAVVQGGLRQSIQNGYTRWVGLAPRDGKRRKLRAKHTRAGATDSAYTGEVTVDPWTPTAPVDYPVPAPAITLHLDPIDQGGVSRAAIRVTFPEPIQLQYSHMEYRVEAKAPGGSYPSETAARITGSRGGPDSIPAQFGLTFRVTPVTVTSGQPAVRSEGTAQEISIPLSIAGSTAAPATSTDQSEATITVALNDACYLYRVYRKYYATVPSPAPSTVEDPANYVGPDHYRNDTTVRIPLDSTNPVVVVTIVYFNAQGIRGEDETTAPLQRVSGPGGPSAPTLSAQSTAHENVVIRATFVTTPDAGTGDRIRLFRDGVQIVDYAITGTDVANGHADITDSTAQIGTTYSYTARQFDASAGLSSSDSTALPVTVTSAGQIPTPTFGNFQYNVASQSFTGAVTPAPGTPAGVTWHAEIDQTSPPTTERVAWTVGGMEWPSPQAENDQIWFARVWGTKTGWTPSNRTAIRSTTKPGAGPAT